MTTHAIPDRCFELHPTPQLILRLDGSVAAANAACERAAGVEPGGAEGRAVVDLVHPDDRPGLAAWLAELAHGLQASRWRARLTPAGSEPRWMDWSAAAPAGEGVVHVILNDLSAANEAKRAARERERFLTTLLSNLPGMVYRCRNEPEWPMEFVSAGSEALTGHKPEVFLEGAASYTALIEPEDRERVWDDVQAALVRRRPYTLRYRIRDAQGELRWVHEQGRGVSSEEGALLALEGFITDITEHVRAEEAVAEKLRVIEAQAEAIRHLSTPIIEVWDGVLTLPIVGAVDRERAEDMTQALLEAVARTGCRQVILDLTGVLAMDSEVAGHLVKMLDAVRLLGAQGVLVGIRPEVARALVALGVDLAHVPARGDLRDALLDCIRERRRAARA